MKTLIQHLKKKSIAQEAVNCWLRFALSQPIDIDIQILLIFTLQYFGLSRISVVLEYLHNLASSYTQYVSDEWLADSLVFALKRA
jgi:hypothetical protein